MSYNSHMPHPTALDIHVRARLQTCDPALLSPCWWAWISIIKTLQLSAWCHPSHTIHLSAGQRQLKCQAYSLSEDAARAYFLCLCMMRASPRWLLFKILPVRCAGLRSCGKRCRGGGKRGHHPITIWIWSSLQCSLLQWPLLLLGKTQDYLAVDAGETYKITSQTETIQNLHHSIDLTSVVVDIFILKSSFCIWLILK